MISLVFATRSATLTDATDLVRTANNHGFRANNQIRFVTIVNTTGISTNTWYYVANNASLTANTFQLTASAGSAVLPLTTNGTGTIDIPISPIQTANPITRVRNTTKRQLSIKFSPVIISKIISIVRNTTKRQLPTKFSSVVIAKIMSIVSIPLIERKFSGITTVNAVSAMVAAVNTLSKFSGITTVNAVSTNVIKITSTISELVSITVVPAATAVSTNVIKITSIISGSAKMNFVTTIPVVTINIMKQITQQVKTLIQFWS